MKIAIGSENPVKVAAVQSVVAQVWPSAHILPLTVDSGVSAMPMSDRECLVGARNRAHNAMREEEADLGIGLEGGVNAGSNRLFILGWVVAACSDGREGIGGTARIPLPKHMADRINDGEELGDVIDEILGEKNIKMKGGTVGALTDGLVPRREAFATAVAYALSPFLVPHLHDSRD